MTPEHQVQHITIQTLEFYGWHCIRISLFRAGGRVDLRSPNARTVLGRIGINAEPAVYVHHLPLPPDELGVPDIAAMHPTHGCLLVECKAPRGTISPEQRAFIARYPLHACLVKPVSIDDTQAEVIGQLRMRRLIDPPCTFTAVETTDPVLIARIVCGEESGYYDGAHWRVRV